MTDTPVLYLVVCAAPPALQIGELVELLMEDGWAVCVIATPTAATWIDSEALTQRTGYPVRSEWRKPGEPDVLPKADAVLVAPATFNTINKWALGISDNLALGILNEALGLELPILLFPYLEQTLASHAAHDRHINLLSVAGVGFTEADTSADPFHWSSLGEALSRLRR